MNLDFWRGKKVLVTGHTGFKGGWLSLWLQQMGAEVTGFALAPTGAKNFFTSAEVAEGMLSFQGDIRDVDSLTSVMLETQPDIVFHLAAQALVRYSYQFPIETYQTNVMGSLHVMEAVRATPSVRAVLMVTTDKCYENKEQLAAYREEEPMGGYDPYSSSKGCVEILISSYRRSYFSGAEAPALASARAGNVIGGGDWSRDRLLPDIVNAFLRGECVSIRNPASIRPWQHVLESLSAYLTLAEKLYSEGQDFAEAWNFGPRDCDMKTVAWIVERLAAYWENAVWKIDPQPALHEACLLKLDSTKALRRLGWQSRLNLEEALQFSVEWYQAEAAGEPMREFSLAQIKRYLQKTIHTSNNSERIYPKLYNKNVA